MDWEIFGFLIFVVIYLVVTISEKTKKRKEKAEKKTKQTVLPAQAFESDEEEADDLPEEEQPTAASDDPGDDPCNKEEQPPIHLHQVTEQEFEAAQEGEDPCHAGGAVTTRLEHHDEEHMPEADAENMRQDSEILRGVIMSEVLMRPAERAALRRIRRGNRT